VFEVLKPRASAALSGTQMMSYTELSEIGNVRGKVLFLPKL
jgi:hypothetical protein